MVAESQLCIFHIAWLLDCGLDEFHTIWHRNDLRKALDDIGRTHASDKRHRPVSVPPRLFAIRGASHVRDAPKTDRLGGLHSHFEQPDRVIADFHGASERRQVHENQTVFDRDGVRSAIRRRDERCGILPLQLALLGYGKLSSWDRIAERADATLIAARGSHVRASDGAVRIDDEHSRRLPVGDAHHRIDLDRRAQFGGQHVFALHRIPTAITDIAGISDEHHHAGVNDREALRVVQGYGKLFHRPAAADAEIVSAVHTAADRDLAVGVE